jgi:ribosomal protein S18 acetylase RimI-like enzyme
VAAFNQYPGAISVAREREGLSNVDDITMSAPIRIEHRLPTPEEHRRLAEAVGWGHAFVWARLPQSLEGSLWGVVALAEDEVVGMGRVVGDGVMYFYIQDVAVLPSHQGQGVGNAVMRALLDRIEPLAPAFVGLFATDAAMPLYQRLGFTGGDMRGLFQVIQARA